MVTLHKNLIALLVGAVFLVGCSSQQVYSPAEIKPVYKIRNTPLPVPAPKWKPLRQKTAQAAKTSPAKSSVTKPSPVNSKPANSKPANSKPAAPKRAAATKNSASSQSKITLHTVRKGQTLYAIAKLYGIPVRAVISANGLRSPFRLSVGKRLKIPSSQQHTVTKGDTGYSISRRYGVTVSALMRVNGIRAPFTLSVGQNLKLPGGAKNVATASTGRGSAGRTNAVRSGVRTKPAARGRSIALPTPPPRSKSGFVWPVAGKLAARFGPKGGGLHNDGINILAQQGAAVKAADAGVVVYASNALEGYGNLLLIKHRGGWMTAYAHNERILVKLNQQVARGELVARVGRSGDVKDAQLHFEIRRGRQALDPLKYLNGR